MLIKKENWPEESFFTRCLLFFVKLAYNFWQQIRGRTVLEALHSVRLTFKSFRVIA